MGAMRRVLAAVAYCGSVRAPCASATVDTVAAVFQAVCRLPNRKMIQLLNAKIRTALAGLWHRKGTATVVFASDPQAILRLITMQGQAAMIRSEPGDRNDWPVTHRLLLSLVPSWNRGVQGLVAYSVAAKLSRL